MLASIAPPMQVTGIFNAAGYSGGSVSPGEIVLLEGFTIGPSPLATAAIPALGTLGTTAGSTTVTFNGTPAPMLYASASAIGVIVPYEVFGSQTATVVGDLQNRRTFGDLQHSRRPDRAGFVHRQ